MNDLVNNFKNATRRALIHSSFRNFNFPLFLQKLNQTLGI